MYALIFQNIVRQISEKTFPIHPDFKWLDIGKEKVDVGQIYEEGKFYPAPEKEIKIKKDDEFRKATKKMLNAIMAFMSGKTDMKQLAEVYESCREVLKTDA